MPADNDLVFTTKNGLNLYQCRRRGVKRSICKEALFYAPSRAITRFFTLDNAHVLSVAAQSQDCAATGQPGYVSGISAG
jgi:hypothetical protein